MNKSLLLFFLSFIAFVTSQAQLSKGTLLVGGTVSFRSNRYEFLYSGEETKSFTYEVQPQAGYFLLNKLAAGVRSGYGGYNSEGYRGDDVKRRWVTLAPFARYYFLPQTEKFNLFADVSYQSIWEKISSGSGTASDKAHGYALVAGPSLFLNPHVALEFTVGYHYTKYGTTSKEKNLATGIGFQVHLDGKKKVSN